MTRLEISLLGPLRVMLNGQPVTRFRADKWSAARAYWDAYQAGIAEAFAAGAAEIPEVVAPYQAAKLDVMTRPDKS